MITHPWVKLSVNDHGWICGLDQIMYVVVPGRLLVYLGKTMVRCYFQDLLVDLVTISWFVGNHFCFPIYMWQVEITCKKYINQEVSSSGSACPVRVITGPEIQYGFAHGLVVNRMNQCRGEGHSSVIYYTIKSGSVSPAKFLPPNDVVLDRDENTSSFCFVFLVYGIIVVGKDLCRYECWR